MTGVEGMVTILLRDVPDELYQQIKRLADMSGRTIPAEVLHLTEVAIRTRQHSLKEHRQAVADLQQRLAVEP